MNRLHSRTLTGALLLSPLLITVEELARLTVDGSYVENESDAVADTASHLEAVSGHLGLWHTAALLEIGYAATWALSLLAVVLVVARRRPVLAVVSGLLGLVSVLGVAMHVTFYYAPLAQLAQMSDAHLAAQAGAAMDDDVILVVALVMFLLGTLLAVLFAGFSLWRAGSLPWWGALGLAAWIAYVFTGPEARVAALANLALLLPFVAVARALRATTPGTPAASLPEEVRAGRR